MRCEVVLEGCTPIPLANYLKALGVFRLVCSQVDSAARGWWEDDLFHLSSILDCDGLEDFFLNHYFPTPVSSPWNGGSGYFKKDSKKGIEPIRTSTAKRFSAYSTSINLNFAILKERKITKKQLEVNKKLKRSLILEVRSSAPVEELEWIDAVALVGDEKAKFPPLLGTGGNDGRLEFGNNFMHRLVSVIDVTTGLGREDSKELLRSAFFRSTTPALIRNVAIGQFAPASAGGLNANAGFESESLVNPWEYILMIEGTLVFAAAATRQIESSGPSILSYPFTVSASSVGHGSISNTDEAGARAELWMPLWGNPTSFAEVKYLFSEGRVQVGRRIAKNGVDFARACATLAVSRGINSFQRFGILKRAGKSYFVTPLTRFEVKAHEEADLLADLDAWLGKLRRYCGEDDCSERFKTLFNNINSSIFKLCQKGGSLQVQRLLIALGKVEYALASNPKAREVIPPLNLKKGWLTKADDGSVEFRLALSLVSLRCEIGGIRRYMSPVSLDKPKEWNKSSNITFVWGEGGLEKNLFHLLERRIVQSGRIKSKNMSDERSLDKQGQREFMVDKPFYGIYPVGVEDINAYLFDPSMDKKINDLVWGLMTVDLDLRIKVKRQSITTRPLPPIYVLLKLNFMPNMHVQTVFGLTERIEIPIPERLLGLLRAKRLGDAGAVALYRLRSSLSINRNLKAVSGFGIDPQRLASALLFPIEPESIVRHASFLFELKDKGESNYDYRL